MAGSGPAWVRGVSPDLEAVITWQPPEEGGLSELPASGRYANLAYGEGFAEVFGIYKVSCDDTGRELPPGMPSQPVFRAKIWFVVPEIMDRHRREIAPGGRFLITEASRVIATAEVVSLA